MRSLRSRETGALAATAVPIAELMSVLLQEIEDRFYQAAADRDAIGQECSRARIYSGSAIESTKTVAGFDQVGNSVLRQSALSSVLRYISRNPCPPFTTVLSSARNAGRRT